MQYHVKCGFYAQKEFKKAQNAIFLFLNSRFLAYNSGYDKYFLGVTEGNSAETKRACLQKIPPFFPTTEDQQE